MNNFKLLDGLRYNRGLIKNPVTYLKDVECNSWLYLVGEEFEKMDGGMSYAQVQASTPNSINVISDPPRVLNLDLARQHVEALDSLPRPTLISCRTGPRSSAVAYMYSGLKLGAEPEEVIAMAEQDQAPFIQFSEYKEWVSSSIESLRLHTDLPGSREKS